MGNGRGCPVYVDLRCLQDADYQFRGVGYHVACLLRARRKVASNHEIVGLIDAAFPALPPEYATLVDRVSLCWNPVLHEDAIFVSASPMTHDPTQCLRFLNHPRVLCAAVVYDFIPMDRDGYLPRVSDKINYFTKLAYLKSFDLFFPISEYSAKRLRELLGISPDTIAVTGASVRESLYKAARQQKQRNTGQQRGRRYFLCVGGGDRRKNVEVVVRAVWLLRLLLGEPIQLKIVGHYGQEYLSDLRDIASNGGSTTFVEFCAGVSDGDLAGLYAGAIATVAPSHIEGFSLPVVEAAVCGSPVIASTCAAQLELIDNEDALFPSTDADILCRRLRALIERPELAAKLTEEQRPLGFRFHEEAVGARFWQGLLGDQRRRPPSFLRGVKPKIAFLTPFPPEASGISRFSELTLAASRKFIDIDLYTNAERPIEPPEGVTDAGAIHTAILRRGPYDAIVSVMGNSHFHIDMMDWMERFGGPCILHDSRLTQLYHWRMGRERFLPWAEKLLRRPVLGEEIDRWLDDRDPPSLFIEPILERAEPLIVHTSRYQQLIRERYGREAALATFPPNLNFSSCELTADARASARMELGIPEKSFAVASFGYVIGTKGIASLIVALELLRSWGIPADLFLVGSDAHAPGIAHQVGTTFGVAQHVHTNREFVQKERYRAYMLAADAAVQLRTYDFGQPSAALADCISAGLPTVANESLSESCDAPSYVTRIPDNTSPLLLAEALAAIYEGSSIGSGQVLEERRQYLKVHNFEHYAKRLVSILGFQP